MDGSTSFRLVGSTSSGPMTQWVMQGLRETLAQAGIGLRQESPGDEHENETGVVLHVVEPAAPRAYRRRSRAVFVVGVAELASTPDDVLRTGYPILIRSLSNLLVLLVRDGAAPRDVRAWFVTLEQGCYSVAHAGDDHAFFSAIIARLMPLATSRLVIDNEFRTDLPESLWDGDEHTEAIYQAGRRLEALDLLPELRGADKPTASRYRHNATTLHGLLSEAVRPYANIITHNPWGEYGHPDHVQVHRVLSSIANRLGRPLWFSNYVSHVSLPLHLRYVSGFNRHYISRPTDVELGRRIAEIYRAERCWTWYDDFEWFDQDTFVDAAVPAAARTSGADKLYGSLCPLNLIRVSPASDVGLAAPRRRSLLRSLLRVAPDRPDRRETPAPARD